METKTASKEYTQFLNEIETLEKSEEKLKRALEFMRKTLSQDRMPAFRDFWDAKHFCLELFKEKIPTRIRTVLWREYVELSDEIRKLKEILDEQSEFAQEQISLAIEAIEKELGELDTRLNEVGTLEIPQESKILLNNGEEYREKQKELDLLNAFAGRLNSLRKELIQTQMRIRNKNQLFERLSNLGNGVFPRRKFLIKVLSEIFTSDVNRFYDEEFKLDKGPYFSLKDEIKAFQSFAKALTIDTTTFRKTRELLSGCWDQIKEKEKSYREKKNAERELYAQNYEKFLSAAKEIKKECESKEISLKEADEKVGAVLKEMRDVPLGANEVKGLKKILFEAKKPLEDKAREEREKLRAEQELEKIQMREKSQTLIRELLEVINQAEALSLEALVEKWEAFVKEKKALNIEGVEQAILENRLGSIFDHIQEKKWQELSEKTGEEMTGPLHGLLDERHKEKRKVKEALECHRKTVGGSGLSLEESMLYQELIAEERLRLDTIETVVEEIEEKLFDIEE